jgi:hypothetical protein
VDTKQLSPNRSRIIAIAVCIFALLVFTLMLAVSCRKPDVPPRQVTTATPTPNPSPSPSGSLVPLSGDTPIIVKGGGSIDLEYQDDHFTGNPLTCSNCTITSLTLDQIPEKGQHPNPSPVSCSIPSPSAAFEISIETNQNNKDGITIKNIPGVGVQIIPAAGSTYDDVITECGDEKKHHSVDGEIKKINVDGQELPCNRCNGNKKRCKIELKVSYP